MGWLAGLRGLSSCEGKVSERQESCWRAAAGERTRDGWTRRVYQAVALREGCTSWAGMGRRMAQWPRGVAWEAASAARKECARQWEEKHEKTKPGWAFNTLR